MRSHSLPRYITISTNITSQTRRRRPCFHLQRPPYQPTLSLPLSLHLRSTPLPPDRMGEERREKRREGREETSQVAVKKEK